MNRIEKLEKRVTTLEKRIDKKGSIDHAKEWLVYYLQGEVNRCQFVHTLFADARKAGISPATLRQARLELSERVRIERAPGTRFWRWRKVR